MPLQTDNRRPRHQNPVGPPAQPPTGGFTPATGDSPYHRKPRKEPLIPVLLVSLAIHACLYCLALLVPAPVIPKPERLLEVDLRHYKISKPEKKKKEKPQVIAKVQVKPVVKPAPRQKLPRLAARPQPVPTLPPVKKVEQPKPTKPPEIKKEEPKPKPTVEKVKATLPPPQPTLEKPKPTPPPLKTDKIAKAPQHQSPQEPENGHKSPGEATPGKGNHSTRVRVAEAPEKFSGQQLKPLPGSGAPKAPGRPKFDEEAGAAGDLHTGRALDKPRPNTHPNRSHGMFDSDTNANDNGGQGKNPQTPLPRGVHSGRLDAGNKELEPGHFDNHAFGGHPGGGSPGLGQRNKGGSERGHNDELAGTDGAGGARLAKAMPSRGGGGGPNSHILAYVDPTNRDTDTINTSSAGRGPGSGGGHGGGRGGGEGSDSGAGAGFAAHGMPRVALNTRSGNGLGGGSGSGVGGPRGHGRGGETAGDGGEGGGAGGGRGGGYGNGNGSGGGGRHRPRFAGSPGGDPYGPLVGGNPNGGGGTGGGPGGPGRGVLLARRGGGGPGDGAGDGAGAGPGGSGDGEGFGHGRGGLGRGPGAGGGRGSGDGPGHGNGGGNGSGGLGHGHGGRGGISDTAGNGDGDGAGEGYGHGRSHGQGKIRLARRHDDGSILGRGLMRNTGQGGIDAYYYEDADLSDRHIETKVYEMEQNHNWKDIPIDWKTFSKEKYHRVDQTIDFNWQGDSPAPGVRGSFFSVKWIGQIFVPKDDDYRFRFEDLDDGGRLILDGEKVIEVWKVQKSSPSTLKSYHLTRGPHKIEIDYVQGPPTEASITLKWMSSSFPWEVVGTYRPGN
ncbi:MAG: hypothetical protein JO316_17710 [Abitibacteriaceae bacterium]|nr:hypothetical protein [Abditibacteriaceae bacterium]